MRCCPILSVFDESQTYPASAEVEHPSHLAQQLHGDAPAGILEAVTDYLTGQG